VYFSDKVTLARKTINLDLVSSPLMPIIDRIKKYEVNLT